MAVADHIDADLSWRPDHRVIEAFGCYVDFAIVRPWGTDVALCAYHSTAQWWGDLWAMCGFDGPAPGRGHRPAPGDILADAVLEMLADYPERMILGDTNEDARYRNDPGAEDFHRRIRAAAYTEAVSSVFSGPVRTNFCVRDGGS